MPSPPAHLKNYSVTGEKSALWPSFFLIIIKTPHLLEGIQDTAQYRLILKAATGSQIRHALLGWCRKE